MPRKITMVIKNNYNKIKISNKFRNYVNLIILNYTKTYL